METGLLTFSHRALFVFLIISSLTYDTIPLLKPALAQTVTSKISGYTPTMSLPTVTIDEVSAGIQNSSTNSLCKKVLTGMLSDYMDLQYAIETPYTTGQRVLPADTTIEDVDGAIADETTDKKFTLCFKKISDTEKSGDMTPQSKSDGTWDPKFTPILVLIRPNY